MCTVVVSLAPQDQVPLLLLGVRDEFTGRPWRPPGRHWPGSPLVGGLDEQAGGTWLAVHPDLPRVACLLNGRGEFAPPAHRRSRGELPLLAASEGQPSLRKLHDDPATLARYDPFYLVCADPTAVLLLSWDGQQPALIELTPATHLLTNVGHTYPKAPTDPTDPKAVRFGPKFASHRPSGHRTAPLRQPWGDWLTLTAPIAPDDGAIIVRQELPDGRVWGSTSVTLVALGADGRLRYDFQPDPHNPDTWYQVDLS